MGVPSSLSVVALTESLPRLFVSPGENLIDALPSVPALTCCPFKNTPKGTFMESRTAKSTSCPLLGFPPFDFFIMAVIAFTIQKLHFEAGVYNLHVG